MDKILDKRQVNNIFKATVKIVKDIDIKSIESIEETVKGLEICSIEDDYISYYIGEYNGTIDKKELAKNDDYFKASNISKQLAYLDISIEENEIKIQTYANVTYNVCYGEETQNSILHETILN